MKKSLYILGIVCVNIFLAGALMKLLHWPGAGVLITTGLGATAVLFLPMATVSAYRSTADKALFWVYLTGFLCAFIDIVGALFKIQHLPGANLLLLIGVPIPFVLFLPVFVYHQIKRTDPQIKGFLGVMFLMMYIVVFSALLAYRP